MNAVVNQIPVSTHEATLKLKKVHIKLIKHPETCLYSGVLLMGESSIDVGVPTAYTDGINKRYGKEFVEKLSLPELGGLVLHENGHVMLKHIPRHKDLIKKNPRLANVAMDYVINDIIVEISKKVPDLVQLPKGALYDPKYHNWSVRQVWDDLVKRMEKEKQKPQQPGQQGSSGGMGGNTSGSDSVSDMQPLDEHDINTTDEMSEEDSEQLSKDIDEAISQGSIIAGRFGAKIPRAIKEILTPKIDWREELREFVSSAVAGRDELTWSKLNRRRLVDDCFMPSVESESICEGVMANDTSGSIGDYLLNMVGSEIVSICETCTPERMRVLWWDTMVHGEQVFEGDYTGIAKLLKPKGGGGTKLSCVSDYITKNNVEPQFLIVFTDGHVEADIKWQLNCPVLWLLPPHHNTNFNPPTGRKIVIEN
jgi:predicted metal-dependent peptidase